MKLISRLLVVTGLILTTLSTKGESAWVESNQAILGQLKIKAQKSNLSYNLVESLTTEVGHRFTGTANSEKAVEWAMHNMRKLGFDKVWKEQTRTPKWTRGETLLKVITPYEHRLTAISLGGNIGTNGKILSANIKHFENYKELESAAAGSLEGKIAFVSYKTRRTTDGSGYYPGSKIRFSGPSLAAKKGAVAFIMRSVGTSHDRFAHTGMTQYEDGYDPIPAVAISNPDADILINILKRTQNIQMSLSSTDKLDIDNSSIVTNVIGEVSGIDSSSELVVLAAHLDSWDVGTGAIDDGVGVGMVISAAHFITRFVGRPKRTIRVILFGGEEIGFVGAKDYVERHKANIMNHQIGVEWDFGNNYIEKIQPGVGENALDSLKAFVEFLKPMGVTLSKTNTAKGQSDISLLGNLGLPAINVVPDGSDYLDFHHNENDTFDKVNRQALIQNTTIISLFTLYAANSEVDFRK